jgi:predicted Zn-dependent protease
MSRIFVTTVLVLLSLFLVSCAEPKPSLSSLKPNQKAFAEEDAYILFALRAEQVHEYKAASQIFTTLYEKSQKKEYLYRSLENDLIAKEYAEVIKIVDDTTQGSFDDYILIRVKVVALIELQKLQEARILAIKLVEKSNAVNDYLLVSDVYIKQQEYDTALKYLESAYIKNYNEKILNKMSIVLYVNLQRKKDAIAQLETHSRIHGCSRLICHRLIGFYSNENNVDGLLSVYLRLYSVDKNEEIADKIIQIYSYKKEYIKLMSFLEESKSNDKALFDLYSFTKNYNKAYLLADDLYAKTGDINYLGQSAIYEYESANDKNDKKLLQSVVDKLERVVVVDSNPLYLNYLGYVLIDHDIDIKKGIKYIKRVLLIQPNSSFYLDSLAWGYYKLGKCKKAKEIMNRVVTLEGGDDPEVKKHVRIIDKCIKNTKVKK